MSASLTPRFLAMAVGGLAIAALATTAAVGGASAAPASVGDTVATVRTGESTGPVVTEVTAVSSTLQPAVRLDAPDPVPTSAPATANQSTCRTGVDEAAMQITIDDISYDCPVYAGGQSTIDAGFVTLVNDRGTNSLLAEQPGDAGTLWLAAHRTSHGGAFAAVPSLVDGALITITQGTSEWTYVVVDRAYVTVSNGVVLDTYGRASHDATVDAIVRADQGGGL
ncbi:MAG: sortase, partial [Actinobacteria bacterium]|nr:sortase [Actinomycetota bacterium]